jgi:hypothetical protein
MSREEFAREFAPTLGQAQTLQADKSFAQLEIDRSCLVLGSELGKGSFGVVYLATMISPQGAQQRTVAVKSLRPGAAQEEMTRFLTEARLMCLLQHQNLVEVVAVCSKSTPFYIVMELMSKVGGGGLGVL